MEPDGSDVTFTYLIWLFIYHTDSLVDGYGAKTGYQ